MIKLFRRIRKKFSEPITDAIEDTSRDIIKTIAETSIKTNKPNSDLNEKNLELMNDKGVIAPDFASSLVNLFKPENASQFNLIKTLIN